jgi:putative intracellular protease/amidase
MIHRDACLKPVNRLTSWTRWRATSALLVLNVAALASANDAASQEPTAPSAQPTQIAPFQARFGRTRPVIAVVGENAGTELTDFVIPYGILSRAGVADVQAVATQAGPMHMRPALTLQPQSTTDLFDKQFPGGADYVIVPAVMTMDSKQPSILVTWIQQQAAKGATVVSICDGALIVAKAGLFNGHRATGHWATRDKRMREYPETQWVENARYVADGKVISSAGVTAAIPLSLALVEAIAGTERAAQVASEIGVNDWSSEHDSGKFHLGMQIYLLAIRNRLAPRHDIGLALGSDTDEVALALTADAFSRSYRGHAYSVSQSSEAVRTQHGLTFIPDRILGEDNAPRDLRAIDNLPAAQALDHALVDLENSYGRSTANLVALQLEYPRLSYVAHE